ncbi:hypothetical protein GCM10009610_67290 [Pseudonocardia xinjiangensis]|jgi:hypothetical protein
MRSAARRTIVTTTDGTTDGPTTADARGAGHARMAGVSGVVFALLFTAGLVLVHQVPGLSAPDSDYVAFYTAGSRDVLVALGLYIVPFAGIAGLWHMIATRTLLQVLRPGSWSQIPHWLQLASGVLFVGTLFTGAAAVGAVALLSQLSPAPLPPPDVARALSAVGYAMVFVYGVRAAGMYMITTTRLAWTAGLLPRWVAALSYVIAAFLLVSVTYHPGILLVFPAWVLAVSILLLVRPPTEGTP